MAMVSERHLLYFSCVLALIFYVLTNAQAQPTFARHNCNFNASSGNYTSNSVFRTNLDSISSILSESSARFYNFSIGQNPDRVYVIALCRGDVVMETCRSCLTEANTKLRNLCPNEKQSIGWDENCMLRYWDQPIFNTMQTLPNASTSYPATVSNVTQFNMAVRTMLNRLLEEASRGTTVQKFATGNITIGTVDYNTTIYALAECTPDLSALQCRDCLSGTYEQLLDCCSGRIGGLVLRPSCNFRYETGRFYSASPNETTSDSGPPTTNVTAPLPSVQGKDNDKKTRTVIIILIPTIICVIFVIACICIFMRKQRMQKPLDESEIANEFSSVESLQCDFDTVRATTNEFSDMNKLGQGGFGVVYKGRLRDGRDIAVKRHSKCSDQGELEFKNEVLLMANLQHRNLVRLIGFCLQGTERLLIYEFIPNASLDHFIFDPQKRGHLDGNTCYKIIGGIARGLLYLHEDSRVRIIHRDLKPSNILLDATMNPKIADFGMARIFDLDENEKQARTQRIVGTYGYMAPEYAMFGKFSVKSDVYSFGVLVLEIISGKKNNHCIGNEENSEYLLSYAWKIWQEGTHSKFIDPTLKNDSFSISDLMRCVHIGLLCVQEKIVDRPTMAAVVNMFNNLSLTLQIPTEPAFFSIDPQRPQVMFKSKDSVNEATITKLSGR